MNLASSCTGAEKYKYRSDEVENESLEGTLEGTYSIVVIESA